MRVQFLEEVSSIDSRSNVARGLADLVTTVLQRVGTPQDERFEQALLNWEAINSAGAEERAFCQSAGRMGLDPYDTERWPGVVVRWLEQSTSAELDSPMIVDLLESSGEPVAKVTQSAGLSDLADAKEISAAPRSPARAREERAYADGYATANDIRTALGLPETAALDDLRVAATASIGKNFEIDEEKTGLLPGRLLGMAGWKRGDYPAVVTQTELSPIPRRFASARGLYLALRCSSRGPRLVTDARTWDQRAARAFAAELLAPRIGVQAMYADMGRRFGSEEAMHRIAAHYKVSERTIEHQIENATD